ncbi:MAG: hypothetical protein RIR26_2348, partial [Pseudomonadota bacterium]
MAFDTVWVVQILGILLSLPFALGLIGIAYRLRPHLWPYLYLIIICLAASLQTWRALIAAPWLSAVVLLALLFSVVVGLPHLWREVKRQWLEDLKPGLLELDRLSKTAFFVVCAALLIEIFFAAFPGYRYDQYNYHLVIPKLVDSYGALPELFGTDHTHFTGVWEFFFASFRLVSGNDLIIQTATTTFTFLSYVIPISGLLWQITKPERFLPLWWVGLPALAIYIHVELEPVVSAKPDFVKVAAAMAIVAAQTLASRERFFMTFFFLVAGMAFKVTWVHTALALSTGLIFILPRHFNRSVIVSSVAGALLGLVCVFPVFVKNILIFGNPIHPQQAGPFKSTLVTEAFFKYWTPIAGAPKGFAETLRNIGNVPWQHIAYYNPFIPGLLLLGVLCFKQKKLGLQVIQKSFPWVLAWVAYLVLWGILLRFDISNRFVAVGCIFPLILTVQGLRLSEAQPRVMTLVIALPLLLNGAFEVKMRRMVKGALLSYSDYVRVNFSP